MDFTAIIIVPTIMYFSYKLFETLIRRKERIMMIEKLDVSNLHALPSAEALNILDYMPNKRFTGLRMGMLVLGIGLGLMVAWALSISIYYCYGEVFKNSHYFREMFYAIYLASPAFFGGLGLIISYLIEQKVRKQEK